MKLHLLFRSLSQVGSFLLVLLYCLFSQVQLSLPAVQLGWISLEVRLRFSFNSFRSETLGMRFHYLMELRSSIKALHFLNPSPQLISKSFAKYFHFSLGRTQYIGKIQFSQMHSPKLSFFLLSLSLFLLNSPPLISEILSRHKIRLNRFYVGQNCWAAKRIDQKPKSTLERGGGVLVKPSVGKLQLQFPFVYLRYAILRHRADLLQL